MLKAVAILLCTPWLWVTLPGAAVYGFELATSDNGRLAMASDRLTDQAGAAPTATTAPTTPIRLAKKKKKKPIDVSVTEAKVIADNIGGTWYYTLRGKVRNQGKEIATNPVVYYEIYDEQDKIVDAGSMLIQPAVLTANGGEAIFQKEIRKGGKVKITLVAWQKQDNTLQEHLQLEFFPRPEGSTAG